MEKKYLIINSGSQSHKHALFVGGKRVYFIHLEIEEGKYVGHETVGEIRTALTITKSDFVESLKYTLDRLVVNKIINNKEDITALGIRVVAPGVYFQSHRIIDPKYQIMLKRDLEESPLHISSVLAELEFAHKILPHTPIVGVSDSAFHANMPDTSRYYAIPVDVSRKFGIFRFGYHGISIQSVLSHLKNDLGYLPKRTIVCHLGGGVSVTTILEGKSIHTSMGFTPLEGLVMATRVGDIDPAATVYLGEKLHKTPEEMRDYLNRECGLLGLSGGQSGDIRDLLKLEEEGNADAKLALDTYALRLKRYIGASAAMLNGVDAIILAGTIGERSFRMRRRILSDLEYLGVELDTEVNDQTIGEEGEISRDASRVKVYIMKTDELGEMARETQILVK